MKKAKQSIENRISPLNPLSANQNVFYTILLIVLIAFTTSCEVNIESELELCEEPIGEVISINREISDFTEVQIDRGGKLTILQGEKFDVEIKGQANILDYLSTMVVADRLRINSDKCIQSFEAIEIIVTMPTLKWLDVTGIANVTIDQTMDVEDIYLSILGTGNIDAAFNANEIVTSISGTGSINLKGKCENLIVENIGTGATNAFELQANKADVKLLETGNAEVNVTNELNVEIKKKAKLYYKGNPTITTDLKGKGEVINAN